MQVPGPITGVSLLRTIHLFYQQSLSDDDIYRINGRSAPHNDNYTRFLGLCFENQTSGGPLRWVDIRFYELLAGFTKVREGVYIVELD